MRFIVATTAAVFALACAPGDESSSADTAGKASTSGVSLTGAGATFPYPLYSKWFSDYANNTGIKINYGSIGSGGGIRQLTEGTVDFGATDSPMTDEEMAKAKGPILHIPSVLGAVVLIYNVPGITQQLKLTGPVIADIYLGKIKKWNDKRIAGLNVGTSLPDADILVVHRSDGSGTTFIFTDYLATISAPWASGPSRGKEVQWPAGLGAKGNEGVTGQVKQTPGAIGYTELIYAKQNKLPFASVQNAAGNFVEPSVETVTAAAAGAAERLAPDTDYRLSIVNAPGAQAYPISSFTWLLVYQKQADQEKGRKLVDFLKWAMTDGQGVAGSMDYAPLPASMASRLTERLGTITVGSGT
ncbi:MAG: phosphate ABC transporter substrate-binding protein PstS [Anaerolineae bacterium]|nr:phosphate ABC transporter substrate-binding protein PstS [Gemmatimonadaceae bacterium]